MLLVNLQEVAGGKKFLELLLEEVNFTGYRLIRRTLDEREVSIYFILWVHFPFQFRSRYFTSADLGLFFVFGFYNHEAALLNFKVILTRIYGQ